MALFDGACFDGTQVTLDGNEFRACDFVDVTMRFVGGEGFELDRDCTFSGEIRLEVSGHARMMLLSVIGMFNHAELGPLVRKLIDKEFAKGSDGFEE